MKKSFGLFTLALIGSLSFSGCSNELDTQQGNNNTREVKFVTGIESLSRTSMEETSTSTFFTAQDAIGVFAYDGDKAVASNIKYVYDGVKWTSDNAITAQDGVQYKYVAYYPYREGVADPDAISVTVNADQTNGISADDFLTAMNNTSAAGAETVSLQFGHAFSLVQVAISLTEESPSKAAVTSVSVEGIQPTATVNAATGEVSGLSGDATSIKMEKANGKELFRAVVPAQTLKSGSKILTVTDANGINYDVRYSKEISYKQGKALQMAVTSLTPLPTGEQIVVSSTIENWTGDEIGSDQAAVTEIPLIQPITAKELTEVVSDTRNFNEESWFKLVQNDIERGNATFEIVDAADTDWGKAAKMTYNIEGEKTFNSSNGNPSFNNSWYKAVIGYNHNEPVYVTDDTYIYKVTAKIKSELCKDTTATSTRISTIMFTCKSKSSERYTCSFAASTNPDKFESTLMNKTPATAGVWEEYTFYINFKLISSTVGSGINGIPDKNGNVKEFIASTPDDYSGFDLRFYTNNPNLTPTIYISDVKMEPYQE